MVAPDSPSLVKHQKKHRFRDIVLSSPDLTSMIIANADSKSQACCIRLCSRWFDLTAKIIWNRIDNPENLFALLPVAIRNRHDVCLYETYGSEVWRRFNKYAKYVRRLLFTSKDEFRYYTAIHHTLDDLAATRSISFLLPNLIDLEMSCGYKTTDPMFFTHKQLRRLTLEGVRGVVAMRKILRLVLPRSPNLTFLHLKLNSYISHWDGESDTIMSIEDDFTSIFAKLNFLQELKLESVSLTPKILTAIATLPQLKILCWYNCELSSTTFTNSDCTDQKLFPSLDEVSFLVGYHYRFASLASERKYYDNVKQLQITFTDTECAQLGETFKTITANWQNLTKLSITIRQAPKDDSKSGSKSKSVVAVLKKETFRPLAALRNIRTFSFSYPVPTPVTDKEIEYLARHWPQLEVFELKFNPSSNDKPTLTLSSLMIFARHCPNLQALSIFIDATKTDDVPDDIIVLENLKTLSFGTSPIQSGSAKKLVYYLDQFCSTSCQLLLEDNNTSVEDEKNFTRKYKKLLESYREEWGKVSEFMKLIRTSANRRSSNKKPKSG